MDIQLVRKYNVPGPRYTSYPTVPFWNKEGFNPATWPRLVQQAFSSTHTTDEMSLYIHLPYCESLCTYCGCNKRITINHSVEKPYIQAVLKEWNLYLNCFDKKPVIKEIHLGGGTPTFFSPDNLSYLIRELLKTVYVHPDKNFSFEAHPKNTTPEHLATLFDLGFTRLSLGIQDFDETVQKTINRVQPFEMVEKVVMQARKTGYQSINFDLIYGLPKQTAESIEKTISLVNKLRPDRIAFYSYAHVPWKSKSQRGYSEKDLPIGEEKRRLYETGKQLFETNGYIEIGMDHFALPSDDLAMAFSKKTLHRNFMGYTTDKTDFMIGLGASSISEIPEAYAQNEKMVENYLSAVENNIFPVATGHLLSKTDRQIKKAILEIMCHFETDLSTITEAIDLKRVKKQLADMEKDEIITLEGNLLKVTDKGKPFVRNVCMTLDNYLLLSSSGNKQMFSSTV